MKLARLVITSLACCLTSCGSHQGLIIAPHQFAGLFENQAHVPPSYLKPCLWECLTGDKQTNGAVELHVEGNSSLRATLIVDNHAIQHRDLKFHLKSDRLQLPTQWKCHVSFPFSGFGRATGALRLDENNNLHLFGDEYALLFILILPGMNAGYDYDNEFVRLGLNGQSTPALENENGAEP
jgi:hypothetical protein